ncbi:MAG: F0F1 ATP synthase subunit B [Eubacteriales bacterium]|nr:F0F1 ATP synthase subunit B [Eubacteriales bacterium]
MLRLDINFLFTIINLLILFALMYIFLLKPVRKIIELRQEEVDKGFKEADEAKMTAHKLEGEYKQSVEKIQEEKRIVLQEASKKADEDYHRIINDANEKAKQIKEDARLEGENQKRQILLKADKEIADMVVSATAKVIAGYSSKEDSGELYNKFLDKAGEKQ